MPNARALNVVPAWDWPGNCYGRLRLSRRSMRFVTAFQRQPRRWIFAEGVMLLVPIGFLDYSTGYEVSLRLLYCVPIFLVAWSCDRKSGVLMSLLAALIWWWADVLAD